jgi:hypothetical protein
MIPRGRQPAPVIGSLAARPAATSIKLRLPLAVRIPPHFSTKRRLRVNQAMRPQLFVVLRRGTSRRSAMLKAGSQQEEKTSAASLRRLGQRSTVQTLHRLTAAPQQSPRDHCPFGRGLVGADIVDLVVAGTAEWLGPDQSG